MLLKAIIKIAAIAFGFLFLGACATTATPSPEKAAAMKSANEVAQNLSQTRSTATSEDGEMICKRTALAGSRFKRKICATKDEWASRAMLDKRAVESIQRRPRTGLRY